jgi:23S rRNA-/tRNA-specific pseudouridylate synthase
MFFENKQCFFIRKPPKIASTYGKEQSFLDLVFDKNKANGEILRIMQWSREQLPYEQQQVFLWYITNIGIQEIVTQWAKVIDNQTKNFNKEQEYGLLNRIDNETSGLLYFAKTPEVYAWWKDLQSGEKIYKYYIAQTRNKLAPQTITDPLAHHKNGKRMLVCTPEYMASRKKQKIKWEILQATTEICATTNKKYSLIRIYKGRRHQIRAHMASIWYPLLWDSLYNKDTDLLENSLHLRSIGCVIKTVY